MNYILFMLQFIIGIIIMQIGINVLFREKKTSTCGGYFFVLCLCMCIWAFGYGFLGVFTNSSEIYFVLAIVLASTLVIFSVFTKFILSITETRIKNEEFLFKIIVFTAIILYIFTILSNSILNMIDTSYNIRFINFNIVAILYPIYFAIIMVFNLVISIKWFKRVKFKRDKFQACILIICITISLIGIFSDFIMYLNAYRIIFASYLCGIIIIGVIYHFLGKYNSYNITVFNLTEYIYLSVSTPIVVVDHENKIAIVNSSCIDFFNMAAQSLTGKYMDNLFKSADGNINEIIFKSRENNEKMFNFDAVCIQNNLKCSISITNIYDNFKEIICTVGVITDLTDKMNFIQQLNETKEAAIIANEAKSSFLANMSHEIRTPMNAIIGMSEIMLQSELSSEVRSQAISIKNAGIGLLTIINDILDLSKIESGKFEIINNIYMLPSIIVDIVNVIDIRLIDKPVKLVVNMDPTLPNALIGDEIRIKQVLINILGNAVKFTKTGFIKLFIERINTEKDFWLLIRIEDSGIGIKREEIGKIFGVFNQVDTHKNREITGTGLGLAICKNLCELMDGNIFVDSKYGSGSTFTIRLKQKISDITPIAQIENIDSLYILIYEPSEVLNNSFTYTLKKLNLDFHICDNEYVFRQKIAIRKCTHIFIRKKYITQIQNIIREFNIEAKIIILIDIQEIAETGIGLQSVYLPLFCLQVADTLNNKLIENSHRQFKDDNIQMIKLPFANILVVDDNEVNLKVATGIMKPYKMNIDTATSGMDAIDMAKKKKYDLIFMDHMMPYMNGIEATKEIRNLEGEYYKNVPIIALTANALNGAKEMFIEHGLNDFLAKPIEISKLQYILKIWVLNKYKENNLLIDATIENTICNVNVDNNLIEGIDMDKGLNYIGGDMGDYLSILETYAKDSENKLKSLKEMLENNQISLFATDIHALKSSSASIGADEISSLSREMEFYAKENNMQYINDNINNLLDKLSNLVININLYLDGSKTIESNVKASANIDKNVLKELREALNLVDIKKIENILQDINRFEYDHNTMDLLKQIKNDIDIFEYDNSIELINKFLKND